MSEPIKQVQNRVRPYYYRKLTSSAQRINVKLMPAKNTIKTYIENGYYHVYNRGVEKRKIFLDDMDYRMFLHFIKYYLSPPDKNDVIQKFHSLRQQVKLLAFCLMPNHYHLLLLQTTTSGMTEFLRAICTNYVCYFNKKNQRVGGLFQGKYKAVLIDNDEYLLHLSRYIHTNPLKKYSEYPYSSYPYYLGYKSANWLNVNPILEYFSSPSFTPLKPFSTYQKFVEDNPIHIEKEVGILALE